MAHLSLSLLGPVQVTLDGEPIAGFRTRKAGALLAYLAVEEHQRPTGHSRTVLAGLLWPDKPERAALTSLRTALADLRTAIGDRDATPPYLQVTRETIQFNLASDHWLDIAAFQTLIEASAEEDPAAVPAVTEEPGHRRLEQAVALYRGDFMQGFSVRDSPEFEEWVLLLRERLHWQAVEALGSLATYYENRRAYSKAVGCARRQVALDPWQENAHRQVMRCLALNGERAAALAQYETCRRALEQELGIEPESETQALYECIREEKVLQAQPALPPHNLPARLTPLVGRRAILAEIRERIEDPACRLLTLVGPGGSGKTRLAVEAATGWVHSHADGVYFVSLASLRSVEAIVPTVAQAIGFSFRPGGDPKQQLLSYLRRKRMLFVLDNYEHLLACPESGQGNGAGVAVDILNAAPEVKILVTSRAGLNVPGEHLLPVGGLDVPPVRPPNTRGGEGQSTHDVRDALRYGAVELFTQSARRVRPGFELTGDNLRPVIEVCRLVQGMPLAILLAAAWVQMLTPAEIVSELSPEIAGSISAETESQTPGQGLDFMETDWRVVPERQRSMRAVFDHSWQLLSQGERVQFAALSVFRGGFTRYAAQQVTGATLRQLMALVGKSFLQCTPEGRYEVHELLRRYAAEKLAQLADAGEEVRDRHCAYYAAALQGWGADLQGARQMAALAKMDVEIDNARAAWDRAAERVHVEQLDQAMDGLCHFYEWRGGWQEGESAFQRAAERLSAMACRASPPGGDSLRVLARLWTAQSSLSGDLGRTELAGQLQRQSLSLLMAPELAGQDTRAEKARLFLAMGRRAHFPEPKKSRQLLERSLDLYKDLDDRWRMAEVLRSLGRAAWLAGDYAEVSQRFQESLAISRSLDDRRGISAATWWFAVIALNLGDHNRAEQLAREALAIRKEFGDQGGGVSARWLLALALHLSGRYAEADSLMEEAMAMATDLGIGSGVYIPEYQSKVRMERGLYKQARVLAGKALEVARERHSWRDIGFTLCILGSIALAKGAYTEAQRLLQESVAAYRETKKRDELGWALACAGYAARGVGHPAQARRHLCEALHIGAETGTFRARITPLPAAALFLVDGGEPEQAVELYALASRYPYVACSRWFEDVAGRQIASKAAGLPADVVSAAQERGRARDLDATVKELLAELDQEGKR